ncbi:hypothetical protein [Paenibacillus sp. FSL L8-0641]|uniref:hypothetical protein n=1 Tax=Paenibacillus sp. FSL L8-0641 TaxID=2921605 RepID=UPI0030F937E3
MSLSNMTEGPFLFDGRGGRRGPSAEEFKQFFSQSSKKQINEEIIPDSVPLKQQSKNILQQEVKLGTKETGKPKWWHSGYVDNLTNSQILLGVKQSSKGLSTLGSSTRAEAMSAGKAWVGKGGKDILNKTTGEIVGFSSVDGMRAFRIQFKKGENMVRANFQENIMIRTERNYNDYNKTWAPKQIKNVHIDILD